MAKDFPISRVQQLDVIVAIWIVQLMLAPLWLRTSSSDDLSGSGVR